MTRKDKADNIKRMLDLYYDDEENCVTDLLTDLRHYCDFYNVDYYSTNITSHSHYLGEKRDEAEETK